MDVVDGRKVVVLDLAELEEAKAKARILVAMLSYFTTK